MERDVDRAVGCPDTPRLERPVPVVDPLELVVDLGQPSVDDETVLGSARARRPLAPELQPDDVFPVVRVAGAPAPVPHVAVRPAATSDVHHLPGISAIPAEPPFIVADREDAVGRLGLVLGGELETGLPPRDHDVERFVAGRQVDPDRQGRRCRW